jgi:hypothetical protein
MDRFFLCFFAVVACSACSDSAGDGSRFGVEYNGVRKSNGLPSLRSDWNRIVQFVGGQAAWNSPSERKIGVPQYVQKNVFWDRSGIISEDDTYISGRWISRKAIDPDSGDGWEELVVKYNYRSKSWECFWITDTGLENISKSKAEELIRDWGL